MTTANNEKPREGDVLEQEVTANLSHMNNVRGEVDVQVATAKRFPRSITLFIQRSIEMATLTPDIAAACVYALPRKEQGQSKMIEGPSARLAEICASAWGNMRIDGRVVNIDDQFVTTRGTCWDLESNVAIAYEVKRRITNRKGERFTDDMIVVTGNAGASIAIRNAIFKVIPTAFWKTVYQKCRQVIAGDAKTFHARRDDMMKAFGVMGVPPEKVCAAIDVKGVADITLEHMATLTGIYNSIKDGEVSIEEAFPDSGIKAPQRKSEQSAAGASPDANGGATSEPSSEAGAPAPAAAGEASAPAEQQGAAAAEPSPAGDLLGGAPPAAPAQGAPSQGNATRRREGGKA